MTRHALRKNMSRRRSRNAKSENRAGTANCTAPSRIASRRLVTVFEKALDILDSHRSVIHQDADGQREAAQGHGVNRFFQ